MNYHTKQLLIIYVFNWLIPFVVLYLYVLKITLRERAIIRLNGATKNYYISLLGIFLILFISTLLLILIYI